MKCLAIEWSVNPPVMPVIAWPRSLRTQPPRNLFISGGAPPCSKTLSRGPHPSQFVTYSTTEVIDPSLSLVTIFDCGVASSTEQTIFPSAVVVMLKPRERTASGERALSKV